MIAGRYTLEREIGRGGAGTVHLAHDDLLGRAVAIKRIGLLPGTTGQDIARAQREARIAAGINHPHVVSIFDLVKDDDCYWLVMELVDGRTLTELVSQEGPLPTSRAAGILAQAADALVQADRAGVVHRDVKPSNIMVDDDDHAKLGDFGIARTATDPALTQTGLVTGSPAYLAPEVASGSPATAASDVWSLGGTLFYALTGRPPYDVAENVLGGLYRIVHDDPPRLPDDHPLSGLLAAMMVKDPEQRWPVERVRDDLRRVAKGRASTAAAERPGPGRDDATIAMPTPHTPPDSTPAPPPTSPARTPTLETPAERSGPVPVAASASTPGPVPASTPRRSRGQHLGWVAAVLVLVLLAGLGAWLLWPGDGERPDPAADGPASRATEEPSTSKEPSASEQPTEEPTASDEPTTEPAPGRGTRAAVRAFVQDYFARVTSDPQATFEMLTPEFQTASGGYERYSGFWSTISSATPYDIEVDPRTLVASYTIDYVTTAGDTKTEQVQLRLVEQDGGYLIAGNA